MVKEVGRDKLVVDLVGLREAGTHRRREARTHRGGRNAPIGEVELARQADRLAGTSRRRKGK